MVKFDSEWLSKNFGITERTNVVDSSSANRSADRSVVDYDTFVAALKQKLPNAEFKDK